MAAIPLQNPKLHTGRMETKKVPSGAVTWKAGQFLTINAGLAEAAADDAVNLKYYALTDQDSAPTAGDLVLVGVLTPDQIFELNEDAATAVTTANVGIPYGIDVASNIVTIDKSDTTNDCMIITELAFNYNPFKYTAADTNPRVRARIIASVIDA